VPLGRIVTRLLNRAAGVKIEGLTAESAARQSKSFRPESSRRMGDFHNISNRHYERIELRVAYYKWRSDF